MRPDIGGNLPRSSAGATSTAATVPEIEDDAGPTARRQSEDERSRLGPSEPLRPLWYLIGLQERTTADALAVLAARLQGRRLTLPIGGRRLAAVVGGISVRSGAEPHQVRIDLTDADYDGLRLEAVAIAADEVRIRPWPTAQLIASHVQVEGRTSLDELVPWLDRFVGRWSLAVGSDGHIEATRRRGPAIRLSVEPAVDDHRVRLDLCAVRWRRMHLALPAAPRLRRTLRLPALPRDARVVAARRHDDVVDIHLMLPRISGSLWPRLLLGV